MWCFSFFSVFFVLCHVFLACFCFFLNSHCFCMLFSETPKEVLDFLDTLALPRKVQSVWQVAREWMPETQKSRIDMSNIPLGFEKRSNKIDFDVLSWENTDNMDADVLRNVFDGVSTFAFETEVDPVDLLGPMTNVPVLHGANIVLFLCSWLDSIHEGSRMIWNNMFVITMYIFLTYLFDILYSIFLETRYWCWFRPLEVSMLRLQNASQWPKGPKSKWTGLKKELWESEFCTIDRTNLRNTTCTTLLKTLLKIV